jgi:hypothetical protein
MPPFALLLLAASPAIASPQSVTPEGPEAIDDPAFAIAIDPADAPTRNLVGEIPPQRLGAKILFVNFDGGDLNGGCGNDPHDDCSQIFQGTVLPYSGDAAKRATVIQVIRSRVEDFGITITDQRPDGGAYDMEMVGNWQGESPGFAGVAPSIDCLDSNDSELSFTLESSGTADGIAEIVLQEAAHTWGLEHVNVQTDLLFPTTSGSNKTFNDDCAKIVEDTMLNESDGWCNQVHTNFCDSGWQNSYQELLMLFGESVPDTIAPSVEIIEPADGSQQHGKFDLVIGISDDQSPVVVDMVITLDSPALEMPNESPPGAYAGPAELSFPISGLPEGDYTVHVAITDESGNPATAEIAFSMGSGAADTSGGPSEGTGSTGETSPGSTTDPSGDGSEADGGSEEGSSTATPGETLADESGCACAQQRGSSPPLALLGLFTLALLPRRRSR